jgi:hypothetical protein
VKEARAPGYVKFLLMRERTLRARSLFRVIAKHSAVPAGAAAHQGQAGNAPSGYRMVTRETLTGKNKKATAT